MTARIRYRSAIRSCIAQIRQAAKLQKPGDWSALLWELDQRAELYRLLHLP